VKNKRKGKGKGEEDKKLRFYAAATLVVFRNPSLP
jgi:hypothetical protein